MRGGGCRDRRVWQRGLTDGTPLLLDKQLGEGHVAAVHFGAREPDERSAAASGLCGVRGPDGALSLGHGAAERIAAGRFVRATALGCANRPVWRRAVEVIDPDGHRPLSLSEARTAQSFRLERAGFYQIRFANGRDAVIGVNPDRRESDLEPIPEDVQQLWSGSSGGGAITGRLGPQPWMSRNTVP